MAIEPQTGYLVVADLTGYTAYLSRSELEHAPTIAGDLLETIVGRLEPPFRLAKFEGDACFLFVEDGRADGSLLLDAIEASYVAFRRRLRSIEVPRPATAMPAVSRLVSTSSCSSTTGLTSTVASRAGTSWPVQTSSSPIGCSRAPRLPRLARTASCC